MSKTLKILKLDNISICILFYNTGFNMISILRISLLLLIPIQAIDIVLLYNNDTSLNDNYFVHRLGLVPLVNNYLFEYETDLKTKFKFILKLQLKFYSIFYVRSSYFSILYNGLFCRPFGSYNYVCLKTNRNLLNFHGNIEKGLLLTKIRKNQGVSTINITFLGTFKDHSKWSFTNGVFVSILPSVYWDIRFVSLLNNIGYFYFYSLFNRCKANLLIDVFKVLNCKLSSSCSEAIIEGLLEFLSDLKIAYKLCGQFKNLLYYETNGCLLSKYTIVIAMDNFLKKEKTI